MRRTTMCVAVLGLLLTALGGVALAAPTVTLKGEAVKIPGFPHTGNILGAGAAVEGEIKISGTEYGGYPPPLIGVKVFLPTGTKLHPQGFPTCPEKVIVEEKEPTKCPRESSAGPPGKAEGFVVFGTERVPETVSVEGFYAPGGGINFIVVGHTPASIEIAATGKYLNLAGGGGFGPEAEVAVPLIETVPGAPDASTTRIVAKLGSAIKKDGKTLYYGTVPKKCPAGGFPVKAELTFAENGNVDTPVKSTAYFKAPCPRR
jgi:hypothetical protein